MMGLHEDTKKLTHTESRLFFRLLDGNPHDKKDLLALLPDDLSEASLKVHVCKLRKKLPPDHDIVAMIFRRRTHYRMVRLLKGGFKGNGSSETTKG